MAYKNLSPEAKKKAGEFSNNYQKEAYDRVIVMVSNKDEIKARAEKLGMSLSQYFIYCVEKEVHDGE